MAIGDELSSLDFESMIGGPLNAVIKAQAQAAVTSVDFIKAVGFEGDSKKPVMVTFSYDKPVEVTTPGTNGDPATTKIDVKKFDLSFPFLTMVSIPFIRVEETTIDFNAKINSIQQSSSATSEGIGVSLKAKAGWGWGSAKLSASYSKRKSSSSSQKIEREYSMSVHVRAVQDELPAGTDRLLGILENSISEVQATKDNGGSGTGGSGGSGTGGTGN